MRKYWKAIKSRRRYREHNLIRSAHLAYLRNLQWINEKEYERAYKIIKEYEPSRTYEDYLKSEKEYKVLDDIISSLISDKEFDKALMWALKASDIKASDGSDPGIDSFNEDHGPSQQKILLKKIENAKKMLSKNHSISDISDLTGLSPEEISKL